MFTTALAVFGLFALRVGLPLVITFLLGEALARFDARRSDFNGRLA